MYYTDVTVIFRAFRKHLIYELDLDKEESYLLPERLFHTVVSWEPLMPVRAAKQRIKIAEVPVSEPPTNWWQKEITDVPMGCCVLFPVLERTVVLEVSEEDYLEAFNIWT
jgi:hypothetical protein